MRKEPIVLLLACAALGAGLEACSEQEQPPQQTATPDTTAAVATPAPAAPESAATMPAGSTAAAPAGAAAAGAGNLPAGVTPAMVTEGKQLFGTVCAACHGPDAKGTTLAPNLTDKEWLNIDGSYQSIVKTIHTGVPQPKQHPAPMPPMGGGNFTDAQINALAAYVYSLSHPA